LTNRVSIRGDYRRDDCAPDPQPSDEFKLSIKDGYAMVPERLLSINMQLSSTQPRTLSNDNCMFHALFDQLRYDTALDNFAINNHDLRLKIVDHLNQFVSKGKIEWPFGRDYTPSMWQDEMRQNGTQGRVFTFFEKSVYTKDNQH
jgi:hypothetical protein